MTQTRHGFLLTKSSRDTADGTEIQYWLASDHGPVLLRIPRQSSVFFIKQASIDHAKECLARANISYEIKNLDLKTFAAEPVAAFYNYRSVDNFNCQDLLRRWDIEILENDIRVHDRHLMERFAYGGLQYQGRVTQQDRWLEVSDARIKKSTYQPTLSVLSLDIECAMDGQLFSVGLATRSGGSCKEPIAEVLMIGVQVQPAATKMIWYDNEKALLIGLCQRITEIDPDLIVGWNLINFDLRILIERAAKHRLKLKIGRANQAASWRAQRNDPGKGYVTIPGRVAIDGIDALRSATWSFTSFSLENVAQTLLNRGKLVEKDVDDRIAEIVHNFHHDKPALAAYNLEDCQLVLDIFDHTKIVDYLVLRSQITGLELDRAGGSVAAFTNLYLPRLHRGGYVAPNLPEGGGLASPGGYVMDSKPGLYRNVLVLDFKSLYPSIIRTFKVDPMGLIEGLTDPASAIPGFRGAYFDREKHYLPQIITDLWSQRDEAKKAKDAVRSQAIKILMNSFYGVLGSGGCRFYDTRLASSITMRGHEIMQTTGRWIEQQGYEVIYGDTDSTFVSLDDELDQEQCEQIGKHLADTINQGWQSKLQQEFGLDSLLEIEFETHFSRFLMPTIRGSEAGSKKRYAGMIINLKNQSEAIVFKGLENVRTDWTELAKEFQAELFNLVFHDKNPRSLVKKVVADTLNGDCDDKLIYRKQLRRKLDLYVKNVPPHVRAARIADQQSEALGKSLKYQNKGWISYLITTNGPEPVEYHQSPIDYDHYIDKQIKPIADGVLPFIGYDFDSIVSNQIELF